MRVLVTGATGFVGQHLVRLLLTRGHTVFGSYLSHPTEREFAGELIWCDVRDPGSVREVFDQLHPDQIYHLAARSSPSQSLEQSREVYETNFWGTYNVLESVRHAVPKARLLIVGSGQCYGDTGTGKPFTESATLSPPNPYALSKAAADMLAWQYHFRFGLHVVRARPFNHTGPGQQAGFVCSDYARRVAEIELGQKSGVIHLHDSGARRDFSDVRDVVRAYELLMAKGKPGEVYNIASGRSITIHDIVSILVSFSSRSMRVVQEDNEEVRTGNIANLSGSSVKLFRSTGWKPRYNIRQTLQDLFEYWKQLSTEGVRKSGKNVAREAQEEVGFPACTREREKK